MRMSFYQFAKGVVASVFFPLYRIEIHGKEHFPKDGAVLLCSNHIDNLDPPTVGICAPRQVHFMAKEELFQVPVLGGIVRKVGSFPVKRGMSDREAIRKGLNVLKDGGVLGLFPEGTRSKDGKLGKGLAGAGFFALKSDASIVPCAIIGTYKPFQKVRVYFGPPIDFAPLREKKTSADEATELIMSKIAELLEKHQS
ncbi:1-acyl-sn-glycerol-3-phosphate acyltransferase [Metabacillus sp. SLBN-84]